MVVLPAHHAIDSDYRHTVYNLLFDLTKFLKVFLARNILERFEVDLVGLSELLADGRALSRVLREKSLDSETRPLRACP